MESRENDSPDAVHDASREPGLPPGPAELHTIGPGLPTFDALARWIPEYGELFCVQSRDRRDPSFVVSSPAYIKQILLTNQQIRVSRRMAGNQRTVVRGRAGTGKTDRKSVV